MKKILLTALLFAGFYTSAQISVVTRNNVAVENGQTYTFTTTDEAAEMPLRVTNISNDYINIKIRVDEVENANGEDVQLCFGGLCLYYVAEGSVYPPNFPVTLMPDESNVAGDHLWNFNEGINVGQAVRYRLSFIQLDDDNQVIDSLLTFDYVYAPELSVGDFNALGVAKFNTLMDEQLHLSSAQPVQVKLYNMNGQMVAQSSLDAGDSSMFVGGLASGMYIAQLENQAGKAQVKVVKK